MRPVSLKKQRLDRVYATVKAEVAERDGHRCILCLRPTDETHHRLPRSRGGKHTHDNLITVHGPGNAAGCHGLIHRSPNVAQVLGFTIPTFRGLAPADWAVCIAGHWFRVSADRLQPIDEPPDVRQRDTDWDLLSAGFDLMLRHVS